MTLFGVSTYSDLCRPQEDLAVVSRDSVPRSSPRRSLWGGDEEGRRRRHPRAVAVAVVAAVRVAGSLSGPAVLAEVRGKVQDEGVSFQCEHC